MSFVPVVERISADEIGEIPGLISLIRYWADDPDPPEDWFREAGERWGSGLAMRRGGELLGFAIYAPPEYLPRANRCSVGHMDPEAALLAYVDGDPRTRRHLLVRVLKEMRQRGLSSVDAVSSDVDYPHHTPTGFLLENGWQPVRRGWSMGQPYTLMRADLGSSVEVGELARGWIGKVRLPKLKPRYPLPGAFVRKGSPSALLRTESKAEARRSLSLRSPGV